MEKETLVVDASVIVKWYFEEEGSAQANKIKELYRNHIVDIIVPDLLYYEFTNAVRYNKDITNREKNRIVRNLFNINLETRALDGSDFVDALNYAEKYDTTIYDTAYYILAKKLKGKYITADKDFYKKINDKGVDLIDYWKF